MLHASSFRFRGKSFTLIEVLLVISIVIFLSAIILPNYKSGEKQLALQRSANKLAQDIRRAAEMAVSTQECVSCGGYGVVFDIEGSWDPNPRKKYRLYIDNGNGFFQQSPTPDVIMETIELEKGLIVKELWRPIGSTSSLVSVNFAPPDPIVRIMFGSPNPNQNQATIILAIESDKTQTKSVIVNKVGLIYVE